MMKLLRFAIYWLPGPLSPDKWLRFVASKEYSADHARERRQPPAAAAVTLHAAERGHYIVI